MKNNKTFGQLLAITRKAHSEFNTQDKLAQKLQIEKGLISKWERSVELPKLKQLDVLCEVLANSELFEVGKKEIQEAKDKLHYARLNPKVELCICGNTECWKCGKNMKAAYGMVDGHPVSPDSFNKAMIKVANEKGIILEERLSKTTGDTNMVSVCQHCNNFLGSFYVHDLWYSETETIAIDDVEGFALDDTIEREGDNFRFGEPVEKEEW